MACLAVCAIASSADARVAAGDGYGTSPRKYREIMVNVRLARFPKSFARSELYRCTSESNENDPSCPKTTSRIKKYRSASDPSTSRIVSARTTLPRDFDILLSSYSNQPWAKMVFGSGSSAASRNAGQYTQWNRTMSLPITCRSAGQKRLNLSCSAGFEPPNPIAVM